MAAGEKSSTGKKLTSIRVRPNCGVTLTDLSLASKVTGSIRAVQKASPMDFIFPGQIQDSSFLKLRTSLGQKGLSFFPY